MRLVIQQTDFVKAFRLTDSIQYEQFYEKVTKELAEILHPLAVVDNLGFASTWRDAGGNTHVTLKGTASSFGRRKEIGGEFVWLKNLRRFRGKIWSELENHSDVQLLMMARDSYRKLEYREATNYLNAIQVPKNLPPIRSQVKETYREKNRVR